MVDRRYRVAPALLALVAAATAVGVHHWLFPLYSLNRDDSVYVAMARLLERGHATYPLDVEPFRPWATATVGDRLALKYSPPWPAALALADLLTGATWVALGVVAGAVVTVTALLVTEVFGDRTTGLVAGVLMALSPVFLVQSGTYLPYVFQLGLGSGSVLLLLRGVRRRSTPVTVAAGALMAVAAWARPYDAVLVVTPFLLYVVATQRRRSPDRWIWWGSLLRVAAGAAPVLAGFLAYNAVVMGDPWRLPYTVTGPQDGFGFGYRGVFPAYTSLFTVRDGITGTLGSLMSLPGWTAGGIVLVGLALAGMVRRVRGAAVPLAALAVIVPVGYLPFWGPWAISEVWDGVEHFGPFYHLAVVLPVVALAAATLVDLARRSRSPAPRWSWAAPAVIVAAMVALTASAVPAKIAVNLAVRDDFRTLQRFVDDSTSGPAVLFLPSRGDLGFNSTTPFLENRPDLDQPVLYAETRGGRDFELVDRFPDRAWYRLTEQLPPGRTTGGALAMDRLRVDAGPTLTVDVRLAAMSTPATSVAYLFDGVGETSRPLTPGVGGDVTWTLAAPAYDGPMPDSTVRLPPTPGSGVLAVGWEVRPAAGGAVQRWERRLAYRVTDGGTRLQLLRPGQGWSLDATPGRGWQPDVPGRVTETG